MTSARAHHASPDGIRVQIDASLEELIPTFLANRRRDVETLRDALRENNFSTIQMVGHRLNGDGGGYGFAGISEIGSRLEAAAARQDRTCIDSQTTELADYLDRVTVVFVQ